jgi:LysR family transcriptional regulator, glycine cleavage system transcriptional activator
LLKRGALPSLRGLMAFEAAARHANFTLAAQELSLTQGAVSRSIGLLEEQLEVTLFVRKGPRISLSSAGRKLQDRLAITFERLESDLQSLKLHNDEVATLRLALPPTLSSKWLIPMLPLFYAKHPRVELHISSHVDAFEFLPPDADAVIYYGQRAGPTMVTTYLMPEQEIAVCAPQTAVLLGAQATADQVLQLPLLHLASRPDAWERWAVLHGQAVDKASRGARFDQFTQLVEAACVGLGVAILPDIFVKNEILAGRLVSLLGPISNTRHGYYLACDERTVSMPAYCAFRDWALDCVPEYPVPM